MARKKGRTKAQTEQLMFHEWEENRVHEPDGSPLPNLPASRQEVSDANTGD